MTRAEFAGPLAEEHGVDLITILTAMSILSGALPQIIALCKDDDGVPQGIRIKQLCMNNVAVARWEIFKTLPRTGLRTRRHRWKVAEAIRLKIIATLPEDLVAMMQEKDVPGQAV